MKKVLFAILAIALYACGETQTNVETEVEVGDPEVEAVAVNYYGDTIDTEGALTPAAFYTQMEGQDTLEVTLTGTINETCAKKGCWMTLDMENGQELRVRFKDYGFFVPTEGVQGKKATVHGIAFTDTLSVDYLKHLAEDAEKSEEEIAAITEPEISMNFEATGVVIED
jgi:hypothetical protein